MKYYNAIGATATYLLPSSLLAHFVSIEALVYHVLRRVIQRHPALSLCIDNKPNSTPQWIRPASIDLKDLVTFKSGGVALEQTIEHAHNIWLDRLHELPVWRVIVSSPGSGASNKKAGSVKEKKNIAGKAVEASIGFFFHHAIGDGLSGPAIHLSFLEVLETLSTQNAGEAEPDSVVLPPDLDLLPSLEAYNLPLGMLYTAKMVVGNIIPGWGTDPLWTGPPIQGVVVEPPRTKLLLLTLPDSTSSVLTQLCRAERTTFTPLLTYLIARILNNIYPVYSDFRAAVPYSLRKHTGTGNAEMTLQVSGTSILFSRAPRKGCASCAAREDVDWDSVRQCKREIDAAAKSPGGHNASMLRYAGDLKTMLQKKLGTKRAGSFAVSNLGLVDGNVASTGSAETGDKPRACFHTVTYSQPAHVLSEAYTFNVATVKDGSMTICLTWQEGIVEEETAKAVMGVLKTEFEALVDPDDDEDDEE